MRPVVDHLMSVFGESLDQILLQLESGVICGDVYTHGSTMADRVRTDEQPQLQLRLLRRSARPSDVQGSRLTGRLTELLDAGRQTADDVAAGERGLHGGGRQATFKIAEHSAGCDACDDLQLVELRITHHQD